MLASLVRDFRLYSGLLLAALLFQWLVGPAGADELSDFHRALNQASAQYRVALNALETGGRDETAAEVHRLRAAWQAVAERFGANRPDAFAADEQLAASFMQIDARLVGALIVIDIGSREAARDALASIEEILSRLQDRSVPPG